jgi:peptide/nickel transport system permease protein
LIVAKAPVTLELACMAMLLAAAAGAPLGAVAAMNRGKPVDALINLGALLGASVPHFWLGVLAILVFAVHLRWLPASGYVPFSENPVRNLQTLILPALVLGTSPAAALMRHTRDAMIGALNSDFARTARAKGLSPAAVVWKHAFRHVLTPLVTMSALWFGELLGGAVLTEQVFTIPGFGKLMVDAVFTRDYAVVQGVALCAAVGFVLLNLLADVLYAVINPRVRGS